MLDLFSVLSIVVSTLLWTLLVVSCSGKKKPKEATTTDNKPIGDNKKPGGNPPAIGAPPKVDAPKPPTPAAPAAAAPPPADLVDEGGDNYEDVNIGGGEPPPA